MPATTQEPAIPMPGSLKWELATLNRPRRCTKFAGVLALLALILVGRVYAWATLLSGQYTILLRTSEFTGAGGEEVDFQPLTQRLDFNLNQISHRNLNFYASLRRVDDLSRDFEQEKVLYAYLDAGDHFHGFSFRLGRQLITHGLDFFRVDAVKLAYSGLGPVNLEAYFGLPVPAKESESRTGDVALGGRVSFQPKSETLIALSYGREEHESDLIQERVGLEFQHALRPWLHLFANTTYNIPLEEFIETRGGFLFRPHERTDVRLEYERVKPEFDLDAIFNVFNTNPYDALRGRLTVRILPTISTFLHLERQFFERTLEKEDDNDLVTAGIEFTDLSASTPLPLDTLNVELIYRKGFAGDQKGIDVQASKYLLQRRLRLHGGFNVLHYEQITQAFNLDTTVSARLGALYHLGQKADIRAELENFNNDYQNNEFRFLAAVTLYFGGMF